MRIGFAARLVVDDFEFAALKDFPCLALGFTADLEALARTHEVRGWRSKYHLDVSHVGLYGRNYLSRDPAERDAHFAALRRVAEFARALGAPLVTSGGGLDPELSAAQCCERALELFPPAIRHVESLGLRFAFSNSPEANFVTGPEAWEPLLEALPSVGLDFDPGHPLRAGKDWLGQLAAWGHRLLHVRVRDLLFVGGRPFEEVPAGLGDTPWGRFFALLYHHGYDGDVNIEPCGSVWTGGRLYGGILLARQHLEQFLLPPAVATPEDFPK